MARIAFVAPPFLGHLNPMMALAGELSRRGHEPVFMHMEDARATLERRGFAFRPVGRDTHPPGHLRGVLGRMAGVNGPFGLMGIIRDVAAATDMLVRDLPDACRAERIDMIVGDQTEAACGLAARHLGLPYVSVANALPLNREPDVPPPFTGWRYDASGWGRERNAGGYRVSDRLMAPVRRVIAGHAARFRLGRLASIEDCVSPLAEISQTVAAFDFPRRALPATFHHVGPLRRSAERSSFAMPADDGRPLVYASLGTLQGGRAGLMRTICRAADRLGVRLVLTHGGALGDRQIRDLPGRPFVHDFVPQDIVLAQAGLAVLHGGLNTVMDALAAGVPIVTIPLAFEQGAIASRIEHAGAGRRVGRTFLGAGRLSRAMRDVANRPSYRAAAHRLAGAIGEAGGVARAAGIVEAVLRAGRPAACAPSPAAAAS